MRVAEGEARGSPLQGTNPTRRRGAGLFPQQVCSGGAAGARGPHFHPCPGQPARPALDLRPAQGFALRRKENELFGQNLETLENKTDPFCGGADKRKKIQTKSH